jgi:hypothetical protein
MMEYWCRKRTFLITFSKVFGRRVHVWFRDRRDPKLLLRRRPQKPREEIVMKKLKFAKPLIFFLCVCSLHAVAKGQFASYDKTALVPSAFKYVIFNNELEEPISKRDVGKRSLCVLVEKKAFSREHLTALSNLLTRRFPRPYHLTVFVFTDIQDIMTPEEMDNGGLSESNAETPKIDTAVFMNNGKVKTVDMYFATGRVDTFVVE